MKCESHPFVAAIGRCSLCETPLCGICARFAKQTLYCEKCEQLATTSAQRDSKAPSQRTRQNDQSGLGEKSGKSAMAGLLREEEERQRSLPKQEPRQKPDSGARSEKIQMAVVIVCCVFMAYQITQSLGSGGVLSQREILVQEQTRNQIEACMLVFWEIALQFSNGQPANTALRCPDTDAPLQVARQDGDVIVRHPRPSALGVSDIYVRRSDPTPVLVE